MMETKDEQVVPLGSFRQKRKKKVKHLLVKLVLVSAVMLFTAFKIQDLIISHLIETQTVNGGTLENTLLVEGLVLREEKVIRAPARGIFFKEVTTGLRIREGQVIGIIKSGAGLSGEIHEIKATMAGLVSFCIDDLEQVLNPHTLQSVHRGKLTDLAEKPVNIENNSEVYRGSPVAKIINDLQPLYILLQPEDGVFQKIITENSESLLVRFAKREYEAEIIEVDKNNDIIMLKIMHWDKRLLSERQLTFELVLSSHAGIVVPATAIFERQGQKGVYIYDGKDYTWKAVEVIFQAEKRAVVQGLEASSIVIINPDTIADDGA